MDPNWLPGRLREIRESRELTQEDLAKKIGVQRQAIARWEKGDRLPGWANIVALCEALECDCSEFLKKPKPQK